MEISDRDLELFKQLALEHAVPIWLLTAAAMLAVIVLCARLGIGNRSRTASATGAQGLQLPADLRLVRVFGARYGLDVFTGVVIDNKIVTTVDTSTTVRGETYSGGHMPWSVETTTTTTHRSILFLRYSNGIEEAWSLYDLKFPVAVGQTVSFIARPRKNGSYNILLAYNHASGQLRTFSLFGPHRIGALAWLIATAVGLAGLCYAAIVLGEAASLAGAAWTAQLGPFTAPHLIGYAVISAVVALAMYVPALAFVTMVRNQLFRRRYVPGIRTFLESAAGPRVARAA